MPCLWVGNDSCPFPDYLKKAKIPLLTSMGTKHMYVAPWHTCGQNTHTYKKIKMFNKIKSRETPGFLTNQTVTRFTLGERTRIVMTLGTRGPRLPSLCRFGSLCRREPLMNAVWICDFSACPWPQTPEGALSSPNRQRFLCLNGKSNLNRALILSFAALRVFIVEP